MSSPLNRPVQHHRTSLDQRTQLGKRASRVEVVTPWLLTSWPGCSEASLVWVRRRASQRGSVPRPATAPAIEDVEVRWRIANGRARSRSRRYFVRNQLRYMWVLTFAEARRERAEVMWLVGDFARRLRLQHVESGFPYWYSPELHPGGHGWHVNLFVPMWLPHGTVEALWGHGYVWATDFECSPVAPKGEPLGLCRTPRDGWRRAAQYGCKYAQKDWSAESVGAAEDRYEVAQGFQPVPERTHVFDLAAGRSAAKALVSAEDERWVSTWDSDEESEWDRPRVITWRW